VENGLIRIPDPPEELHPTEGTAFLLPDTATAPDSTATVPRRPVEVGGEGEVDVTIRIPSGLWIRGQGLDAELAGELRLHRRGDLPTLTGELRAVRGTLILLGRSFQLDRGSVVFYGDDEANPSLDVRLTATIDGVVVGVTITGTALEPELSLTSEPEMPEGDIMSYLVFGRPLDNLDQDQVNLVERRAAEVAAAMGAVKLQEGLSKQLGVDMVTIRSGRAEDESSAIVVGKYLSPRLLVKYERLLEEQAAQFINLEYLLTRRLKIETLYGAQDRQGIEVEWSNEY
jgi:translocation and assembly module TamB